MPEIEDLQSFTTLHRRVDDLEKNYLEPRRPDRQSLDAEGCWELEIPSPDGRIKSDLLFANNVESRIRFAEIAVAKITEHPGIGDAPLFVTIVIRDHAVPLALAREFDHRVVQGWLHQALPGFDFVAVVEAALFPRVKLDLDAPPGVVSWHVHAILWNTSYARLNRVLAGINRDHQSLVEGKPAAFCRRLKPTDVTRTVLYMLKAPQKQYRTYRPKGEKVDWSTGELLPKPLRVQKDWLRTGQRVALSRVMQGRYLDRLLFGQGEGRELCRAIRDEALAPFRLAQQRANYQRKSRA